MTVIFNNDLQTEIMISECLYDYITKEWSIKLLDQIPNQNDIQLLTNLQNTPITSITLKENDNILHTYDNFSGEIVSIKDMFQYTEFSPLIVFECTIKKQ